MKRFTTLGPQVLPPDEAPEDDRLRWRHRASCRGTETELFFPAGTHSPAVIEQIEAAKAVCLGCPVRAECLGFALESNQEAGVWGGMSEEERRKLRRPWMRARRLADPRSAAPEVIVLPGDGVPLSEALTDLDLDGP